MRCNLTCISHNSVYGTGGYLPPYYCIVPGSILGQYTWNLWWTKWYWYRIFTECFSFLLVSEITPMFYTHSFIYCRRYMCQQMAASQVPQKKHTVPGIFTGTIRLALKKLSLLMRQRIIEWHKNVSRLHYKKYMDGKKLRVIYLQILLPQCYGTHSIEQSYALFHAMTMTIQWHATLYRYCAHL